MAPALEGPLLLQHPRMQDGQEQEQGAPEWLGWEGQSLARDSGMVEASPAEALLGEFLEGRFLCHYQSPFLLMTTFVLHTKQVSSALPSPPN